jgi:hypothetical protein
MPAAVVVIGLDRWPWQRNASFGTRSEPPTLTPHWLAAWTRENARRPSWVSMICPCPKNERARAHQRSQPAQASLKRVVAQQLSNLPGDRPSQSGRFRLIAWL